MSEPRRVEFTVYGTPQPKGSARAFVAMKKGQTYSTKNRPRAVVTSDNTSLKAWEGSVREAAQAVAGEVFFTGAVRLRINFRFPRPKSVTRPFMTTRPDCSKLVRGAEDALIGLVFQDDSQVVELVATKRYVDGPAGARIVVEEVR